MNELTDGPGGKYVIAFIVFHIFVYKFSRSFAKIQFYK